MWSAIWHFIAKIFQGIFHFVPFMGLWFNKFLIVVGFVAFFIWLWYMSRQREVEKFD